MTCRWILGSRSKLRQGNLDPHKGWKATTSPTNQVMMPHLCWKKLTVSQATLVRETLPQILPCLRGLRGSIQKAKEMGVGL